MMRQLLVCMKKEWLELIRSKKIVFYVLLPVLLILLVTLMLFAMDFAMRETGIEMGEAGLFTKSAGNAVGFYATFMLIYYGLLVICMQIGSSAREIRKRQWLIPMTSGMRRSNIVLAKVVVLGLAAVIPAIVGMCLNSVVSLTVYPNAEALTSADLFRVSLGVVGTVLFFSLLTISLSALTGKTWLTAVISLVLLILGSQIMSYFDFSNYTPYLFFNLVTNFMNGAEAPTIAMWGTASAVSLLILAVLIYFAMYKRVK